MTPTAALTIPLSPFKGLRPFEASDQDALLFFGREAERELISANLMASRFTVLYGDSGVGKTSLLAAGVLHHLRNAAARNLAERGHPEFVVVMFSAWSEDPITGLLAGVRQALSETFGTSAVRDLGHEESLTDALRGWTDDLGCDLLVIIDQAEEYFVYHESEHGPLTFAEQLPELVTTSGLRVSVLLSIREDALAKLDHFKGRMPNLFGNYLRLEHLDRDAARSAILGPVAQHNRLSGAEESVEVDSELVEAVLDQTEAGRVDMSQAGRGIARGADVRTRVEAPYLQLVLERLWSEEIDAGSRTLRLATLERLGGATAIVRNHLERALDALSPEQKDIAASLFNYLVTPSGTKIAHAPRDLAGYAAVAEDQLSPVLSVLLGERILRHAESRNGARAAAASPVEIFHDVLADPVLAWRTRHEADRALVDQQREAERRHRRTVQLAAGSLLALAVVTAIAVFALIQRSNAENRAAEARAQRAEARVAARSARARELITRGTSALSTDPRQSLRLGLEAARLEPTPALERLLRNALVLDRLRAVLPVGRGAIVAAELTPDGRRAVVTSNAGEARIFRRSGALIRTLSHGGRIRAAGLDGSGSVLVLAGDRGASLWEVKTGRRLRVLPHADRVLDVSFSGDGRVLATGSRRGAVRIWTVADGGLTRVINVVPPASKVVLSPDGSRLVAIGGDHFPRLFDVASGAALLVFDQRGVKTAVFSPGGRLIATASADHTARIWDALRAEPFGTALVGHRGRVVDVAFSPRGTLLATASTDGTGRVWDLDTGRLVTPLLGHGNFVVDVAFSRDGNYVAGASTDRTARVWKADNGSPLATFLGHRDSVRTVSFSRDGATLLTAADDGTARIWLSGITPELRVFARMSAPVTDAEFSPKGDFVLSTTETGRVEIRTAHGARIVRAFREPQGISRAKFSPDGSLVAAAAGRIVSIKNWRTGRVVGRFPHPKTVADIAFSDDGRLIATAGDDGLARIWSTGTQQVVRSLKGSGRPLTSVAFDSTRGRLAAGSDDHTALVWSLPTGTLRQRLRGHDDAVTAVTFSRDGRRIATSSRDHETRIWDASTGRRLRVLGGHFAVVSDIAFSPDGRWVVTAGPQTAGLWDARTGALLRLRGGLRRLTAVSFDGTGRRLVVGGEDGAVRIYNCVVCGRVDELVAVAKERFRLAR